MKPTTDSKLTAEGDLSPLFIGRRLNFVRTHNGMTCQQLADITGLSKQAISKYETGYMNPSNRVFKLLCEVFSISPKFFTQHTLDIRLNNNKIIIL